MPPSPFGYFRQPAEPRWTRNRPEGRVGHDLAGTHAAGGQLPGPDRVPIELGGMKASGIAAGIGCAAMACIPPAAAGEPTAVQGVTASERRKAWARLLAMNPDHQPRASGQSPVWLRN